MQPLTEKDQKKVLICLALYLTSIFASNTIGLKIMPFVFGTHITVAIFMLPVVFLMTDVIGEVYGRVLSRWFVRCGLVGTVLFIAYNLLSLWMPWAKEGLWAKDAYNLIFGVSGRIGLASTVAFIISEYQDVFTFFFVRSKIGPRLFWLRSLLSNIWSQLLDSIIFMTIAFAGVYSTKSLIIIIFTLWIYKVIMGFFYTPLSYLGIYLLKGKNAGNVAQN